MFGNGKHGNVVLPISKHSVLFDLIGAPHVLDLPLIFLESSLRELFKTINGSLKLLADPV